MAKLTEQDIVAWNGDEADYMNDQHLEFFKELLLKQQDELIHKAGETTTHMKEHEAAPDPADRASQEEEYALELRTVTVNANCWRKFRLRCVILKRVNTVSAAIQASRLVCVVCWRAQRQLYPLKRKNAVNA